MYYKSHAGQEIIWERKINTFHKPIKMLISSQWVNAFYFNIYIKKEKKTSLYLMSASPDFGMDFQRMELCVTVMALQDKLQNEKEGREHFTLLLHFTTDISTYYKIAAYIVFISLSCRALGMSSLGTLQRGCRQNSLSFLTPIAHYCPVLC